jgi:LacI family transcriptional regulator
MPTVKPPDARKPATVTDIARKLGVSPMTVSRALNAHPAVNDETRRKVSQLAQELNYRPNRWARSLVTRRSGVIGLLVPDISHAFYAEVTIGIQQVIEAKGFSLILSCSHRDTDAEVRALDSLVASRVEGLIIASTQPENSVTYVNNLRTTGIPFVLVDRFFRRLSCTRLTTDDMEVGRIATEHLISLGHRRIAHLSGAGISTGRLREEGYRHAMGAHGMKADLQWIVAGNFRAEESRRATHFLLQLPNRPTAIFAASDYSAFGALSACRDNGLEVPRDLSVIGAGDIEGASNPYAFLTTITWAREKLGREAARLLMDSIADPVRFKPANIVFPPSLIVRQSTAPPTKARRERTKITP